MVTQQALQLHLALRLRKGTQVIEGQGEIASGMNDLNGLRLRDAKGGA